MTRIIIDIFSVIYLAVCLKVWGRDHGAMSLSLASFVLRSDVISVCESSMLFCISSDIVDWSNQRPSVHWHDRCMSLVRAILDGSWEEFFVTNARAHTHKRTHKRTHPLTHKRTHTQTHTELNENTKPFFFQRTQINSILKAIQSTLKKGGLRISQSRVINL